MTAILKLSVTDTGNNHTCRAGSWVTSFTATYVSAGERCKFCLTCGKRMAVEVLPKAGHLPVEIIESATWVICSAKDTVVDEGSRLPDTPDDSTDGCGHICHKKGFMGFIWKIIRVFWKLFKMNPICECGAAHY